MVGFSGRLLVWAAFACVLACSGKQFDTRRGAALPSDNGDGADAATGGETSAMGSAGASPDDGGESTSGRSGQDSGQNTGGQGSTTECEVSSDCDDGNPCTDDACSDRGRCLYGHNKAPCEDDGNECTRDVCDEGECTHPPQAGSCTDDGVACTEDLCMGDLCAHPATSECECASASDCDDGNPCTDEVCDASNRCQYSNNTAPCQDDGSVCTDDLCAEGICTHLPSESCRCDGPTDCNDDDPCSTDSCESSGYCSYRKFPVTPKGEWAAEASHSADPGSCGSESMASGAIDSDPVTRWTSGKAQSGNEWFEVDFGEPVTLNRVLLNSEGSGVMSQEDTCTTSPDDYPRRYLVRMSNSPRNFGAAILAEGQGSANETAIEFESPGTGRYLLISQVGSTNRNWWSIHELAAVCQP